MKTKTFTISKSSTKTKIIIGVLLAIISGGLFAIAASKYYKDNYSDRKVVKKDTNPVKGNTPKIPETYSLFSAKVYLINPTVTPRTNIKVLDGLTGDSTLHGETVHVNSFCDDSEQLSPASVDEAHMLNVFREDNIFVYDQERKTAKFNQVNAYYHAKLARDYFFDHLYVPFDSELSPTHFVSDEGSISLPILTVNLCDPWWTDESNTGKLGSALGATFLLEEYTISMGCYSRDTCHNIGVPWEPSEDRLEIEDAGSSDLVTIIHEMAHGMYDSVKSGSVPLGRAGISSEDGWYELNEAYSEINAVLAVREIAREQSWTTGQNHSQGAWEDITPDREKIRLDLNNNYIYSTADEDKRSMNNTGAIAGALFEISQNESVGEDLARELIFKSWKHLDKYLSPEETPTSLAGMLALLNASKEKYGSDSERHRDLRDNVVVPAFERHGIVCESCVSTS